MSSDVVAFISHGDALGLVLQKLVYFQLNLCRVLVSVFEYFHANIVEIFKIPQVVCHFCCCFSHIESNLPPLNLAHCGCLNTDDVGSSKKE